MTRKMLTAVTMVLALAAGLFVASAAEANPPAPVPVPYHEDAALCGSYVNVELNVPCFRVTGEDEVLRDGFWCSKFLSRARILGIDYQWPYNATVAAAQALEDSAHWSRYCLPAATIAGVLPTSTAVPNPQPSVKCADGQLSRVVMGVTECVDSAAATGGDRVAFAG